MVMDPTQFRERFKAWKDGKKPYKDGLPAYGDGKQTKNKWKYTPSDTVRSHIAKWEDSDFAEQNKQFGGDAVGAKAIEFANAIGEDIGRRLTSKELDGIFSTFYNLSPKTFNEKILPSIKKYAMDPNVLNRNELVDTMSNRYTLAAQKYQKGIKRRAAADTALTGLTRVEPQILEYKTKDGNKVMKFDYGQQFQPQPIPKPIPETQYPLSGSQAPESLSSWNAAQSPSATPTIPSIQKINNERNAAVRGAFQLPGVTVYGQRRMPTLLPKMPSLNDALMAYSPQNQMNRAVSDMLGLNDLWEDLDVTSDLFKAKNGKLPKILPKYADGTQPDSQNDQYLKSVVRELNHEDVNAYQNKKQYMGENATDRQVLDALQQDVQNHPDSYYVNAASLPDTIIKPTGDTYIAKAQLQTMIPDKDLRDRIMATNYFQNDPYSVINRLYTIWNISGQPDITDTKSWFQQNIVQPIFKKGKPDRANYNPLSNTMRVNTFSDVVAEMAHAYQYNSGFYPGLYGIMQNVPGDIKINGKTGYETPGHVEYIAHKQIQPTLDDYIKNGSGYKNGKLPKFEDGTESTDPVFKENGNPDGAWQEQWLNGRQQQLQENYGIDPKKFDKYGTATAEQQLNNLKSSKEYRGVRGVNNEYGYDFQLGDLGNNMGQYVGGMTIIGEGNPNNIIMYPSQTLPPDTNPNYIDPSTRMMNGVLISPNMTDEEIAKWNSHLKSDPLDVRNQNMIHERTHALSSPLKNKDKIGSLPQDYKIDQINKKHGLKSTKSNSTHAMSEEEYHMVPNEIYAGLMQQRYALGLTPDHVVTKEEIRQWKNEGKLNQFLKDKPDDVLLEYFNEVASNPNPLFDPTNVIQAFGPAEGRMLHAKNGKSPIYIKPANRGKLTRLKQRTGKSESELYNDGNPAHKKMVVFARNARKWKH